jgi:hypothetical protein
MLGSASQASRAGMLRQIRGSVCSQQKFSRRASSLMTGKKFDSSIPASKNQGRVSVAPRYDMTSRVPLAGSVSSGIETALPMGVPSR